jgi:Amt family ammonium transporter
MNLLAINSGDTAWMLISSALVMLMTPAGLTLFYGGLTQRKSVLNTIGMSYTAFCTASVVWVVIGYSIAFSGDGAYFGNFDYLLLKGITITDVEGTIPTLLFVFFQGTFAAIAIALVSGSIIERVRYSTWFVFSILWVILVYSPVTHWVWGGGFLSQLGELDFAGGTVIHVNAGVAGLVLVYLLGNREGYKKTSVRPASVKLMILGSALLWFGWFGFNGGSQLAADGIAANALLVTNVAAACGGLSWLLIEWFTTNSKPTLIGSASGVVSGLVGITPAAGYVDVSGALVIGLGSGLVGYFGVVKLKKWLGYDDTLDVFGIHGLVGAFGAIATGIFANPMVNEGNSGLLYGNPDQVWIQVQSVLIVSLYSAVATFIIYKVISLIFGTGRVSEEVEKDGMDMAYHGEKGFDVSD